MSRGLARSRLPSHADLYEWKCLMPHADPFQPLDATPKERQLRFARAWWKNGCQNARQAAREAGYAEGSVKKAYELTKLPVVLAEVEKLRKKANAAVTITPESVRERLLEVYNEAMNNGNFAAAIRATELMGKDVGMFDSKTTVHIEGAVAHQATGELGRLLGIAKNAGIVEGEFTVTDVPQLEGPDASD